MRLSPWGYSMSVNDLKEASQAYAHIQHPGTRALFSFWEKIRGEKAAPNRDDLDLKQISPIVPNLLILERDHLHQTYKWRLAGSEMASFTARSSPLPTPLPDGAVLRQHPETTLWCSGDQPAAVPGSLSPHDRRRPRVAPNCSASPCLPEMACNFIYLAGFSRSATFPSSVTVALPSWSSQLPAPSGPSPCPATSWLPA